MTDRSTELDQQHENSHAAITRSGASRVHRPALSERRESKQDGEPHRDERKQDDFGEPEVGQAVERDHKRAKRRDAGRDQKSRRGIPERDPARTMMSSRAMSGVDGDASATSSTAHGRMLSAILAMAGRQGQNSMVRARCSSAIRARMAVSSVSMSAS